MPRGRKVSPEQIGVTLRQIEVQLAQGKSLAPACKEAGISEQTQGRVPEAGDLLQLERGPGRDRGLARPIQPSSTALGLLGYRPPAPVTRAFVNHLPTSPTMQ